MAASLFGAILGFKGEYWFLSNFAPVKVVYEGMHFSSVEHAYQAAKTEDKDWRLKIASCTTPAQSKRMGKKVPMRADWDDVKVQIMYQLLVQKFKMPSYRLLLLKTGDAYIEETNYWNDRFWGCCPEGEGKNHLGLLLMRIRDEIRQRTRLFN